MVEKKAETPKKIKTTKTASSEKKNNLSVYDIHGKVLEEMELPDTIFNVEISSRLLNQYVRVFLANRRQGTHSTLTRSEVTGTTKKIYKQKGTGHARHGSDKASLFRGGGVTFGPRPKDYSLNMNSKQKRKALLGALTQQYKHNILTCISGLLSLNKTKAVLETMKAMELNKVKSLLLILPTEHAETVKLGARNLDNVRIFDAKTLNAYEILKSKKVVFSKEALEEFIQFMKA